MRFAFQVLVKRNLFIQHFREDIIVRIHQDGIKMQFFVRLRRQEAVVTQHPGKQ